MCSIQSQCKGAAFGRHHKGGRAAFGRAATFVVSFVLALNGAHVLAVSTTHVLRLSKVEVLALNKAHVLRRSDDCRSWIACRSLARLLAGSVPRSIDRSLGSKVESEVGGGGIPISGERTCFREKESSVWKENVFPRARERMCLLERDCVFRRENLFSG